MEQNDPRIALQRVKQNQGEGNSIPTVSVIMEL